MVVLFAIGIICFAASFMMMLLGVLSAFLESEGGIIFSAFAAIASGVLGHLLTIVALGMKVFG